MTYLFLQDQFDFQGAPVDIEKAMNIKFGRRLSNHTYRLHKQFMELKEAKGEEYARTTHRRMLILPSG